MVVRRLRRLVLLAAVVGVIGALVRRQAQGPHDLPPPEPPRWPAIDVARSATTLPAPTDAAETATPWVPPVDGQCPDGYPIKANDRSHIFHAPGGRSYDRTVPERCYANTADAVADGYRAAKT